MLSRHRIIAAVVALGLMGTGAWFVAHRGSEAGERRPGLREVRRDQLDLREGVLFARGESGAFDGMVVEYFPGMGKRIAIEIHDGKAHGVSRGWYENGRIETEEHFVRGVSHGLRTRWYANGNNKSQARIMDGVIVGSFTRWHENGQKAAVVTMVDGLADGVSEAWDPSGKLKSRAVMKMGVVVEREFFENPVEPSSSQTSS